MKRVIIFLSVLILAYLCGVFYSLSFDISFWTKETRATVITLGMFTAFAISSFPYIDEITKTKSSRPQR